ncbi:MAG: lipid biosynthesis acyltransferase [Frankiales bacterium]|nr:lipid biosynthesis acyltransferase [Frankiales bacterium]
MNLLSSSYTVGWAAVKALPEPVARRMFQTGADAALLRKDFPQLAKNLARVTDQDVLKPAIRSYARYWCEVFRLPAMKRDRIVRGTTTTGEHLLRESVAGDRGTIMVLSHSGNWDAAGAWCGFTDVPFTTVAERLKPESLYEQFLDFRRSLGMEVLPLTGGERPPSEVLQDRLAAGGTICLLADRDLSKRGVEVDFFGSRAKMPAGPAKLALDTGANLMPTTLSFTDDGWHIVFQDYVPHTDIEAMTQGVADAFAREIAQHPADWHMLQKLWIEDL